MASPFGALYYFSGALHNFSGAPPLSLRGPLLFLRAPFIISTGGLHNFSGGALLFLRAPLLFLRGLQNELLVPSGPMEGAPSGAHQSFCRSKTALSLVKTKPIPPPTCGSKTALSLPSETDPTLQSVGVKLHSVCRVRPTLPFSLWE